MHWQVVGIVDASVFGEPELAKLIPERVVDIRSGHPIYFGPNKNYLNEIPKELLLSVTENFCSLSNREQYYIAGAMILAEKAPSAEMKRIFEYMAKCALEHVHMIHLVSLGSLDDDAIKSRSELIKKDI